MRSKLLTAEHAENFAELAKKNIPPLCHLAENSATSAVKSF
jgi:hypothetical protein